MRSTPFCLSSTQSNVSLIWWMPQEPKNDGLLFIRYRILKDSHDVNANVSPSKHNNNELKPPTVATGTRSDTLAIVLYL